MMDVFSPTLVGTVGSVRPNVAEVGVCGGLSAAGKPLVFVRLLINNGPTAIVGMSLEQVEKHIADLRACLDALRVTCADPVAVARMVAIVQADAVDPAVLAKH